MAVRGVLEKLRTHTNGLAVFKINISEKERKNNG